MSNKNSKKEYDRLRYLEKKDEIDERTMEYYFANREKMNAAQKKYNKTPKAMKRAKELRKNRREKKDA